jgi:hypothetical protein
MSLVDYQPEGQEDATDTIDYDGNRLIPVSSSCKTSFHKPVPRKSLQPYIFKDCIEKSILTIITNYDIVN